MGVKPRALVAPVMTLHRSIAGILLLGALAAAMAEDLRAQGKHPPHSGRVSVSGLVTDSAGAPLAGARVSIVDTVGHVQHGVTTVADGWFEIGNLPEGYISFFVRRLGYRPRTFTLDVHKDMQGNVTIVLDVARTLLDTVVVSASLRRNARLEEFYERKAKGFGYFVETREIRSFGKVRVTDVLRHVPGVLVTMDTRRGRVRNVIQMRDGCMPTIWYDGILMRGTDLDEIANAESLQALEVYTSPATLPIQFRESNSSCGAVIAWSRG